MKHILHYKHLINFLLACIVFVQASVFAQPAIQWDKTIGGIENSLLFSSQQTADGGYILGGISNSGIAYDKTDPGVGREDYWIVKLSADGTKEWDQAYGGNNSDILVSVQQTSDGGYILGGNSISEAGGDKSENNRSGYDQDNLRQNDYWIVKVSADGTKEWDKSLGGAEDETLGSIIQTTDGGYIVGGLSSSGIGYEKTQPVLGFFDFWIVKLAANGTKQWDKTHGSIHQEDKCVVKQTADGGYILRGNTRDYQSPRQTDYIVTRLSADGTSLWQKIFGGTGRDVFADIEPTKDGGFILGGYSDTDANGDKSGESPQGQESYDRTRDYWVLKLTANGIKDWDRTLGGLPGESLLSAISLTSDGGYILGGSSTAQAGRSKTENNNGISASDYWVVKINAKGNKIWDKTIGGKNSDELQSVQQTNDGGYFLAGFSNSSAGVDKTEASKGERDYWIVKLSAIPSSKTFTASAKTLSFTYQPGSITPAQTITVTGSSGITPQLSVVKSEIGKWLTVQQSENGLVSLGINATGLSAGTYTVFVTFFAPGYSRVVIPVVLKVISEEANNTFVRINAGGDAYAASGGRQFRTDQYFAGIDRTSSVTSGDILNTTDDVLYRSGRCSPSFSYNIPVANGKVNVVLHFAEIWYGIPGKGAGGTGKRQFNVTIEGSRKLTNFDIFAAAGGAMRAVQKSIPVTITDGMLNIDFTSGAADLPRVSAIEVIRSSVTLKPIADAYIDGDDNRINFGTAPNLDVKNVKNSYAGRRSSYLKFSLATAPRVGTAKLRIYGNNHENSNEIYLHAYGMNDDSWTENGIIFDLAPQASTPRLSSVGVTNVAKYYELDVTSFIKAQQQTGDVLVSLLLTDSNFRNTRLVFNSRENAVNPPQLVIEPAPEMNAAARTSEEEVILVSEPEPEQSSVYPNPAGKQFTVQVSSKHSESITLDLLNSLGQSYNITTVEKVKAGQKAEVNIAPFSLSTGIYMLKIHSEAATEVINIMVTE